MSHTLDYYNIAYWYADESHHKCGYCKSERGSISYGKQSAFVYKFLGYVNPIFEF